MRFHCISCFSVCVSQHALSTRGRHELLAKSNHTEPETTDRCHCNLRLGTDCCPGHFNFRLSLRWQILLAWTHPHVWISLPDNQHSFWNLRCSRICGLVNSPNSQTSHNRKDTENIKKTTKYLSKLRSPSWDQGLQSWFFWIHASTEAMKSCWW